MPQHTSVGNSNEEAESKQEYDCRFTGIVPFLNHSVGLIDSENKKLREIPDYFTAFEKQSPPDSQHLEFAKDQHITITMNCDDHIDEVFWNGQDVRKEVDGVDSGADKLQTLKFDYCPDESLKPMLAVACFDN